MAAVEEIASWPELVEHVGPALGDDQELIRQQFEAGHVSGWRIRDCWVLLRGEGSELVIVAMAGKGLQHATGVIINSARRTGFKTLRAHTERPGLLRLIQRAAPQAYKREIVIGLDLWAENQAVAAAAQQ